MSKSQGASGTDRYPSCVRTVRHFRRPGLPGLSTSLTGNASNCEAWVAENMGTIMVVWCKGGRGECAIQWPLFHYWKPLCSPTTSLRGGCEVGTCMNCGASSVATKGLRPSNHQHRRRLLLLHGASLGRFMRDDSRCWILSPATPIYPLPSAFQAAPIALHNSRRPFIQEVSLDERVGSCIYSRLLSSHGRAIPFV
ncbi:hypothetical protein BDN71DRAFT_1445319 [Pleurotus eryngii]|uniref:Uncharacterized protein n=1 Tax=Pleurotus eryngii TaxID=5323 RepID=A0A9P6D8H6_PLEER|nr:hypothetical protein BDN71DRAFT_1445319 [Pleurotus eryngii]